MMREDDFPRLDTRLLEAVLAAIPEPIFILDENGVYLDVRGGHDRSKYHEARHLIGRALHEVFDADVAATFMSLIRESIQQDRIVTHTYSLTAENINGVDATKGPVEPRWFEAHIYPIGVCGEETRAVVWIAFDVTELRMTIEEKDSLIDKLESAQDEINVLQGIIPICSSCKKVRDDEGYWHQVEVYVRDRSDAKFSHSICSDCVRRLYPDLRVEPEDL